MTTFILLSTNKPLFPLSIFTTGYGMYVGFLGKYSNRQTYIISPDSKIEYVFTDVEGKVATHADDVLATVTKLQAS